MERTAICACGAASVRVSGEPVAHSVCHCNNCKKRTGSAFGMSAYFRMQSVIAIEGSLTLYALHNAARKEDQQRHFCSQCGTTLYWVTSSLSGLIGIASGCFAENPLAEPGITASHSKKFDWVTVPTSWHVWPE